MFTAPPLPLIAAQIAVRVHPTLMISVRKRNGKARQQGRAPWSLESLVASGSTVTQTSSGSSTYTWPDGRAEFDSGTGTDSVGLSIYAHGKVDAKYRWAGEPGSEPPSKVYARVRVRAQAQGWGEGRYAVANGGRDNEEADDSYMVQAVSTGPKYQELAGSTLITIPGALATASSGGYAGRSYVSFQYEILPQFLLSYIVGDQVPANYRKGPDDERIENKHDKDGKQTVDIAFLLDGGGRTWTANANFGANNPNYSEPNWEWSVPNGPPPPGSPPGASGNRSATGPRVSVFIDAGEDPGEGATSFALADVTDNVDGDAPKQGNTLNINWHYPYEGWKPGILRYAWDEMEFRPDEPQLGTATSMHPARGRYFVDDVHYFAEEDYQNTTRIVIGQALDFVTIKRFGQLKNAFGTLVPEALGGTTTQSHPFEGTLAGGWQKVVPKGDGSDPLRSTIPNNDWSVPQNQCVMTPRLYSGYKCRVWKADSYGATGYSGVSSHFFANWYVADWVGDYRVDDGINPTPGGGTGGGGMVGGGEPPRGPGR